LRLSRKAAINFDKQAISVKKIWLGGLKSNGLLAAKVILRDHGRGLVSYVVANFDIGHTLLIPTVGYRRLGLAALPSVGAVA